MSDTPLFDVDETLTVAQVNRRLAEAVRRTFRAEVWVQGQIRNLTRSGRGHVYFDLCDPTPAGAAPRASIAVTLFDSNRQMVNRILTRTGNAVRIDDGIEVRIKAKVELYMPRGQVQLNMTSIDPEFTLGRLGADRDHLLRELAAENLLDANKQVALPVVPLRVGLVTSAGSAAQADFHEQIAACGFAFTITTLSTRVQGEFAPEEIAQVIARASSLEIDVLAIVRGGGARTDLAAFDTAPVARAIAGSSLAVICGIGHEIDTSVADLVAHTSLKTPTACAQFLIDRVAEFVTDLDSRSARLAARVVAIPVAQHDLLDARARALGRLVAERLDTAERATGARAVGLDRRVSRVIHRGEQRLDRVQGQVVARSDAALTAARRRCEQHAEQLRDRPGRVLRSHAHHLDLIEARVGASDPTRALERGYSITTTASGTVVRDPDAVSAGDEITTRLATGTLRSTVVATESTSPQTPKPPQEST